MDDHGGLDSQQQWVQIARDNWLSSSKPATRVQSAVIKDNLWTPLEKEAFTYQTLQTLESLQLLERYLWPGFTEDSSDQHVLLIALILNVKRAESLPSWTIFDRAADFASLFRRFLSLSIDTTIAYRLRAQLLITIIGAFQSLDNGLVRKECAPLVSIAVWQNLHSDATRQRILDNSPQFKKAWRAASKRYDGADKDTQARQRFERAWLYTLILDFLDLLHDKSRWTGDSKIYAERFMELLTDLQSQFPTRRYVNTLLKDLNLLVLIKQSPLYHNEDSALFRDFYILLRHYTAFPIDDQTGRQLSKHEASEIHTSRLAQLQRMALKHFPEKLRLLALSNYGSLEKREELSSHMDTLTDAELKDLAAQLDVRLEYPSSPRYAADRNFLREVLLFEHEKRLPFQDTVQNISLLPTEQSLYEPSFLRNEHYDGTHPLAIPKVNLQYLSIGDFLWRSFILFRCESFYEIRKDMEDVIKRLKPEWHFKNAQTQFTGSSRLACQINKPAVVEVSPPKVGDHLPAEVRAEITLDVSRMNPGLRAEWESLRTDDVVYLLSVKVPDDARMLTNGGTSNHHANKASFEMLRCAEVQQVLDENGRPLRYQTTQTNGYHSRRPQQRRLIVKLDALAYQQDSARKEKGADVYEGVNLLVRRRGRENNFKPMLQSMQRLTMSEVPLPSWLLDVFLGLGDPAGASYKNLQSALTSLDFRDTFLDWSHLQESLPDTKVKSQAGSKLDPPFVLETSKEAAHIPEEPSKTSARTSRKRKREEPVVQTSTDVVEVSTYQPPNTGPYLTDAPKTNRIRFTPAQVEAIKSGTQPGLTVIVGPPGTGKTDVATQIINNIYHNFPQERTLLVAHSNQALNQLFQKIVALDIDERHLLRLGHGEGELQLDSDASYSKHGRVESFLEMGSRYLAEVSRLAASMEAPGAHGSSCETADYFNSVYVKPAWKRYCDNMESSDITAEQAIEQFPFHIYFSNAPQPLFAPGSTIEAVRETARGCYRHIDKIFSELEDIRPFEILRSDRTKANYLLIKEARIIAMTSTHAAIRRKEIADLGFHYDNVIMEEAAQITEIENFIPLAMQSPPKNADGKPSETPLKRVVLCGDHLQNSPIVQNMAFRQYANLEQSLFLRLVRLGVPTILLDKQGRARPSLAFLYSWRYANLGNLPLVSESREFTTANAGFKHDFQFIDVPDYKGKGEMTPSPHFVQNLGEAEYAVALFMYMRLLGYPARKISILTMYAGQKALIRDVLNHRCKDNRLFGLPRIVATVDKYQGEQNDCKFFSSAKLCRGPPVLTCI